MKKILIISLISIGFVAITFSTYAVLNSNLSTANFTNGIMLLNSSPDTSITIDGNKIVTKFYDKELKKDKELKILMKKGEVDKVFVDGKKLSEKEIEEYKDEINFTLNARVRAKEEIEKAKIEIKEAKAELEKIDIKEINKEIELAMQELEKIDWNEINESIAIAMEEIKDLDINVELENIDKLKEIHIIESEDIMEQIKMSIECVEDIVNDIPDMISPVLNLPDDDNNYESSPISNTTKEQNLENKLRELEK